MSTPEEYLAAAEADAHADRKDVRLAGVIVGSALAVTLVASVLVVVAAWL